MVEVVAEVVVVVVVVAVEEEEEEEEDADEGRKEDLVTISKSLQMCSVKCRASIVMMEQ